MVPPSTLRGSQPCCAQCSLRENIPLGNALSNTDKEGYTTHKGATEFTVCRSPRMRRGTQALFDRRSSLGLVGNSMDVETGAWVSRESTIGPGSDSYYEYLLKVQTGQGRERACVRACTHLWLSCRP
jgi:hypothetical protein